MQRKILIVAYHFPPDSKVGAIRPAKFAKYLSRCGWQPHILTVKEKYIPDKEGERLKEVENLPIARTVVWPTIPEIFLSIRNRIASLFRKKGQAGERCPATPSKSVGEMKSRRALVSSLLSAMKRYFISLFAVPDDVNGWLIPAVWQGYRLIKSEGIQIIMTSSPPQTTALVGLILAKLTGARLLTDLRDPWFLLGGKPERLRCALTDRVEMWLEKSIMKHSDKVIATNDQYTQFLRSHYPFIDLAKFYTLHNGYDPEDFTGLEIVERSEKFTLSYLGTFYFTRTPKEFLFALSQLLKEGVISPDELEVSFFGNVTSAGGQLVEDMIRFYGLSACVHLRETVPYRKSLFQMKRSDLLLLFAPDDEEQYYAIPGKTFEYIGAGRYILCIGDRGATAEFIRKTGSGVVVNANNVNEIKNAVHDSYLRWKSGRKFPCEFDRRVFEREALTRELSQLLVPRALGGLF